MLTRHNVNKAAFMAKNILAAGKQENLLTGDRLSAGTYNNKEQGA